MRAAAIRGIEPVIHRLFDIPSMARIAVGATWVSLSPAQQQLATEAFDAYVSATYADRFDSYSGQQMEIVGDGMISQLATQRSEFGAILRRDGFDGLISALQRKVDSLTGNAVRVS